MDDSLQAVVALEAKRAGAAVGAGQVRTLAGYLELLGRWGRRVNLTADPAPGHVARRLLPDALVLSANLPPSIQSAVDVGSGSGILGLALSVCRPAVKMTLVEPSRKRCSFLRTVAHELELSRVEVLEGKLEDVTLEPQDLACSRATWAPEEWLRRGVGLVAPGGHVVALVVREGDLPASRGLKLARHVSFELADGSPRVLGFYVSRETSG